MSNGGPVTLDEVRDLLAEAGGGGDFYAPLFLRVEPDGSVTADFEGHLHAEGLDLDAFEGTSQAPADDSIRWLREADGAMVAQGWGYTAFSEDGTVLAGVAGAAGRAVRAQLRARDDDPLLGGAWANVQAFVTAGGEGSVSAFAQDASGPNESVLLVDGGGSSAFLQLAAGPAPWTVDAGAVNITGDGTAFRDQTVDHDLGAVPAVVTVGVATGLGPGYIVNVSARTSTQITFRLRRVDGANFATTIGVNWLALRTS